MKKLYSLLPLILATIKGKPRSKPDIVWSNTLWTHNIFRFLELIFWREDGIRAEALTTIVDENGEKIVHTTVYTFEALCAYFETITREFLAFKLLPFKLTQVQFAENPNTPFGLRLPGIMFVITFDNSNNGAQASVSPLTFSHTCSGPSLILFVLPGVASNSAVTLSVPTYNSVATTLAGSQQSASSGNLVTGAYFLTSPSTGANTVSVGFSGTNATMNASAVSYSGAASTGQPDATNGVSNGGSGSPTVTVTTTVDKCWVVGVVVANGTETAGLTARGSSSLTFGGYAAEDTNGVVTPAGAKIVNFTSVVTAWAEAAASFSPSPLGSFRVYPIRPRAFAPGIAR